MNRFDVHLIRSISILAIILLLQVILSRRANKWMGLIFPTLTFVTSFMYPFVMLAPPEGLTLGFFLQMVENWLIVNIPTGILLAIYFICRRTMDISN